MKSKLRVPRLTGVRKGIPFSKMTRDELLHYASWQDKVLWIIADFVRDRREKLEKILEE
jgi:hypothetical protein